MMNDNVGTNGLAGRELTEEELTMIQGGNIFGDLAHAVSSGVKALGHAIAQGAQAVAKGLVNQALADVKSFFSRFF